jgi:hypothetical protein
MTHRVVERVKDALVADACLRALAMISGSTTSNIPSHPRTAGWAWVGEPRRLWRIASAYTESRWPPCTSVAPSRTRYGSGKERVRGHPRYLHRANDCHLSIRPVMTRTALVVAAPEEAQTGHVGVFASWIDLRGGVSCVTQVGPLSGNATTLYTARFRRSSSRDVHRSSLHLDCDGETARGFCL